MKQKKVRKRKLLSLITSLLMMISMLSVSVPVYAVSLDIPEGSHWECKSEGSPINSRYKLLCDVCGHEFYSYYGTADSWSPLEADELKEQFRKDVTTHYAVKHSGGGSSQVVVQPAPSVDLSSVNSKLDKILDELNKNKTKPNTAGVQYYSNTPTNTPWIIDPNCPSILRINPDFENNMYSKITWSSDNLYNNMKFTGENLPVAYNSSYENYCMPSVYDKVGNSRCVNNYETLNPNFILVPKSSGSFHLNKGAYILDNRGNKNGKFGLPASTVQMLPTGKAGVIDNFNSFIKQDFYDKSEIIESASKLKKVGRATFIDKFNIYNNNKAICYIETYRTPYTYDYLKLGSFLDIYNQDLKPNMNTHTSPAFFRTNIQVIYYLGKIIDATIESSPYILRYNANIVNYEMNYEDGQVTRDKLDITTQLNQEKWRHWETVVENFFGSSYDIYNGRDYVIDKHIELPVDLPEDTLILDISGEDWDNPYISISTPYSTNTGNGSSISTAPTDLTPVIDKIDESETSITTNETNHYNDLSNKLNNLNGTTNNLSNSINNSTNEIKGDLDSKFNTLNNNLNNATNSINNNINASRDAILNKVETKGNEIINNDNNNRDLIINNDNSNTQKLMDEIKSDNALTLESVVCSTPDKPLSSAPNASSDNKLKYSFVASKPHTDATTNYQVDIDFYKGDSFITRVSPMNFSLNKTDYKKNIEFEVPCNTLPLMSGDITIKMGVKNTSTGNYDRVISSNAVFNSDAPNITINNMSNEDTLKFVAYAESKSNVNKMYYKPLLGTGLTGVALSSSVSGTKPTIDSTWRTMQNGIMVETTDFIGNYTLAVYAEDEAGNYKIEQINVNFVNNLLLEVENNEVHFVKGNNSPNVTMLTLSDNPVETPTVHINANDKTATHFNIKANADTALDSDSNLMAKDISYNLKKQFNWSINTETSMESKLATTMYYKDTSNPYTTATINSSAILNPVPELFQITMTPTTLDIQLKDNIASASISGSSKDDTLKRIYESEAFLISLKKDLLIDISNKKADIRSTSAIKPWNGSSYSTISLPSNTQQIAIGWYDETTNAFYQKVFEVQDLKGSVSFVNLNSSVISTSSPSYELDAKMTKIGDLNPVLIPSDEYNDLVATATPPYQLKSILLPRSSKDPIFTLSDDIEAMYNQIIGLNPAYEQDFLTNRSLTVSGNYDCFLKLTYPNGQSVYDYKYITYINTSAEHFMASSNNNTLEVSEHFLHDLVTDNYIAHGFTVSTTSEIDAYSFDNKYFTYSSTTNKILILDKDFQILKTLNGSFSYTNDIIDYNNKLFVATDNGLYGLNTDCNGFTQQAIATASAEVYDLDLYMSTLLLAVNDTSKTLLQLVYDTKKLEDTTCSEHGSKASSEMFDDPSDVVKTISVTPTALMVSKELNASDLMVEFIVLS